MDNSFLRGHNTSEFEFIQKISFFFSLCSLRGIILEFGFLPYFKLCSWFFNEQRQLFMRLHPLRKQKHTMCPHPLTTTWQLFMCLHLVMNKRQLTYFRSLKNNHVLFFFLLRFFPWYQSQSQICFSADTHMANREWSPPMLISPCNDRDGWRRDGLSHLPYPAIVAHYYRPLRVREPQLPSPQPGECFRVLYFLVTYTLYI